MHIGMMDLSTNMEPTGQRKDHFLEEDFLATAIILSYVWLMMEGKGGARQPFKLLD